MDVRAHERQQLIDVITKMGYPAAFGEAIADNLRSEKTMHRMTGYLLSAKPKTEEEIVDEMLAIMSDRDRWMQRKEAEYYNRKYNEYLNSGFEEE